MHWLDGWLIHCLNEHGVSASAVLFITEPDLMVDNETVNQVMAGVAQMADGVPLAYLTGSQGFWGREFSVTEATLIPRADTERLVEAVLDWLKTQKIIAPKILDLGTGTGCIGITLALELPDSQVTLVDISADALAVATKNSQQLNANNVISRQSAWYKSLVAERFDVIVSNPPYIDARDAHLSALKAEPVTALIADNEGLADIIKIIDGAKQHLKLGGLLAIEHGYDQGQAVAQLFNDAGFSGVKVIKDYGNNDRLTIGIYANNGCE